MFSSAAELAREIGVDPSTVRDWINRGLLRSYGGRYGRKRERGRWHRIPELPKKRLEQLKKPNEKWNKTYSNTEIAVLLNAREPDKVIAKMIGRTPNSVRIKKCRLRKSGILRKGQVKSRGGLQV